MNNPRFLKTIDFILSLCSLVGFSKTYSTRQQYFPKKKKQQRSAGEQAVYRSKCDRLCDTVASRSSGSSVPHLVQWLWIGLSSSVFTGFYCPPWTCVLEAFSAVCGPGRLLRKRFRRGHAACGNILAFSFFFLLFIYCYLRPWTNDRGGRLAVRRGGLAPWLRPCPCLGPLAYNYSQSSLKASIGIFLISRAVNSNSRPFLLVFQIPIIRAIAPPTHRGSQVS